VGVLQAQLLYHESFDGVAPNTTRTDLPTVGWFAHGGTLGAYLDSTTARQVSIRGAVGADGNRGFVHAEYSGSGTTLADQRARTTLIWTNQIASLNLLPQAVGSVTWMQGNGVVDGQYRVAVQVGGQWYVSQPAGAQGVAVASYLTFGSSATQVAFDFASAVWYNLAFDGGPQISGTVLSLHPLLSAVLPGGALQGIGLFIGGEGGYLSSDPTGHRRFDDFMIFGVPPESGGGGAGVAGNVRANRAQQHLIKANQARIAKEQRLQQHRRNQQRQQSR